MSDIFDDFPIIGNDEISESKDTLCESEHGEIISAQESEVIADYPDSSADVDIDIKYKRFIDYFLVCGNKKKAAKLAGFNASSDDSLKAQAWKAFRRPEVAEYYRLKKTEMSEKAEISYEAFMAELVSIATLDIKDVVETEVVPTLTNETVYAVHFKNIEDIAEYARKAVKAIEIAKDGTPKMIFYDKIAALKMIGEIKGYMKPDSGMDENESGVVLIPEVLPDDLS